MPTIELETYIDSDLGTCFDLSRSIDLHKISTAQTNEEAISGITTGLINSGEFVTWQATHFGITQKLTSKITAFDRPLHFRDEQVKGIFKYIIHDHYFEEHDGQIVMKDIFRFHSPCGFLGKIVDKIILKQYLTRLLKHRNQTIKEFAESDRWKTVLD